MKVLHNKDLGLLIIRVLVGIVFAVHGWLKVSDMQQTINQFAKINFSPFWAYVTAYVELLGGIALIIGFATFVSAVLLAITMLVATKVTWAQGFYMFSGPLALFGVTLGLVFTGSGKYSIGSSCGCPCKEGACPIDK